MEQKITGIVLHTLKYNDTSNIVDIYTEQSGRASFFCREAAGGDGTLKRKSCLSFSEFFFFSVIPDQSRQKNAAGEFSFCFVFLLFVQKKNEKTSRNQRKTHFFTFFLKKTPKTFGVYKKKPYLCTRFQKGSELLKSWCGSSVG